MPKFREKRPARLLVEMSHENRNCNPKQKTFSVGYEVEAVWVHFWMLVADGNRSLGQGKEGETFEFI